MIIYMAQEGRGIGLVNKIRAYELQDKGMNTVEANEALGFAADERDYSYCKEILSTVNISSVRLMTNNPRKIKGLEDVDIKVTERVSIEIEPNKHNENYYVDFDKDRLLFHMNSTEGPCICKGDINNDGKEDVFIGGAYGYPGILFIQQSKGKFKKIELNVFQKDKNSEDVDCKFFYANDDGFLDLYDASGGSEFSEFSTALADR